MRRTTHIAGAGLALALAALLALPGWLGAAETVVEQPATEPAATRGHLGLRLEELTPELQTHFGAPPGRGVLVASVEDGGPAAAAGIRVGDVITAVDGLAVGSAGDLGREIRRRPGESVTIELYRDREPRRLVATLGERQAAARGPRGRTPEEWAAFGERWAKWGEEFGERFGEQFGDQFGEQFGERWGEEHAERWQRLAEEMAARGEGWEEMGEEIGKTIKQALSAVDWDQIGKTVAESMKAIDGVDWEAIGEDVERRMEGIERRLETPDENDGGG